MTKLTYATVLLGALSVASAAAVSKREVLSPLPQNADDIELQFQPHLDFDTDGCYQTAAIDASGKRNAGLGTTGALNGNCRDEVHLDNSNTYSRRRCNNGVCGIVYEYYYPKDQTTAVGCSVCGHRHDFENVVVFAKDGNIIRVAPSCHGKYDQGKNSGFPTTAGTHPLIVYHKDGASTHCHRFANDADIAGPENHKGVFFRAPLVGWRGWPSVDLRSNMNNADWGGPDPKTKDAKFAQTLRDAGAEAVGLQADGPDGF